MRRVIFNQKGGVGKSSIATNLAALSAANGYKTLLIDLDVQGNSSHYLGYDINRESNRTVADLLNQTVGWFSVSTPVKDFPQPTPFSNLEIIPSSPKLEKKLNRNSSGATKSTNCEMRWMSWRKAMTASTLIHHPT